MLVAPSCSEMPVCTDQVVEDPANRHIFHVYIIWCSCDNLNSNIYLLLCVQSLGMQALATPVVAVLVSHVELLYRMSKGPGAVKLVVSREQPWSKGVEVTLSAQC